MTAYKQFRPDKTICDYCESPESSDRVKGLWYLFVASLTDQQMADMKQGRFVTEFTTTQYFAYNILFQHLPDYLVGEYRAQQVDVSGLTARQESLHLADVVGELLAVLGDINEIPSIAQAYGDLRIDIQDLLLNSEALERENDTLKREKKTLETRLGDINKEGAD